MGSLGEEQMLAAGDVVNDTGGLEATAGGITMAILAGLVVPLIFIPKDKA